MSENQDVPLTSDRGDEEERPDVLAAMATYSADGQADDASGNDAAAGARQSQEDAPGEGDREPHGPN